MGRAVGMDLSETIGQDEDVGHDENAGGSGEARALRAELAATAERGRLATAELNSLQERFQRELVRVQTAERGRVLVALLGTIDDLDCALSHTGVGSGDLADGLCAIASRAIATVESFGYPRFAAVGDSFDPALHDVASTVPATHELVANAVVAVAKVGYGTAEHLLRPATVVVAKGPG